MTAIPAPQNPNFTAPMAPPAPSMPSGTAPQPGDESAMAAAMAAGPASHSGHLAKMTKPSHNIHGSTGPNMPAYGPSAPNPTGAMPV